jgi:phosphopantetheinyl transferase (holo-ACP synthase)
MPLSPARLGFGCDLVATADLKKLSARGALERVMHPQEKEPRTLRHYAKIWALKEACIKALKLPPSAWLDLLVETPPDGPPRVRWLTRPEVTILATVSHAGGFTLACVLALFPPGTTGRFSAKGAK